MNSRYLFPRIWIEWTPKPFRRYNFRQWALPEGVGISWLGKDWIMRPAFGFPGAVAINESTPVGAKEERAAEDKA